MSKYCNKCGTENPDDAKYCGSCGSLIKNYNNETEISSKEKDTSKSKEEKKSISINKYIIYGIIFIIFLLILLVPTKTIQVSSQQEYINYEQYSTTEPTLENEEITTIENTIGEVCEKKEVLFRTEMKQNIISTGIINYTCIINLDENIKFDLDEYQRIATTIMLNIYDFNSDTLLESVEFDNGVITHNNIYFDRTTKTDYEISKIYDITKYTNNGIKTTWDCSVKYNQKTINICENKMVEKPVTKTQQVTVMKEVTKTRPVTKYKTITTNKEVNWLFGFSMPWN